ncbi:MAG: glutamate--tRNA ligase [Candidatus Staskawiczbacteria bacterium RIFCSPLOWO2_01_FULL_40_39]|uniref:Glutamate--tRNA ligase n=1 Tax=Candidatus Staskawiczbacteria bacterium RIFCSPHIGHO2_01_FULL_39_25 TaxID=1802202 RepID=A0A1G2HM80_9BACT|nr:MAG: glutamate--tRNA ligase [Candidatus Staskawiczbacteria bacterium RIFCSPHIGHO2_01_FULL_39_25]OGZ73665.1 MAG: glutamate--tRNA ligase [Candidatus Staskawiczbacteria bacterium RIFCSPLOWO2_01_FULL_40_39]OGZ75297.1 MAG: glutamate--tRNA ligase [Candidatus Staskawiczbacteria bacterium RIFCSPLOWO2_02_FULL_39_8]
MNKKKQIPLQKIRLRFPPSPTGPLHIGNARTILFNYLFAQKNKGATVLRIEDTDKERSKLEWVQNIIDELQWLGITWDEGPDIGGKFGPYKQSQRLDIYKKYLEKLLVEGKAYYCICTTEELEAKRQDQQSRGLAPKYDGKCRNAKNTSGIIRFKVENKKVVFNDLVRGDVEFDMGLVGDIVIAKNLQEPLYHFAVVVDDYEMQISHIIRGEDHLSNTPKQILLQEALGFFQPTYGHVPLLLNPDKSKMSKRAGDVAVSDYHQQGYLPEALINFMVLLGWNPGTEKEVFSLKDLIKEFSIEKVQKAGAVFNVQKLDSINAYYIRQKTASQLMKLCLAHLPELAQKIPKKTLEKIIEIHKARMKKLSDIAAMADYFFKETLEYDKNILSWKEMGESDVKDALDASLKVITGIKKWDIKTIEKTLLEKSSEFNGQKNYPLENRGYLLWPLRVALSGKSASAGPFEIAEILGKEKTLQRIQDAIKILL